MKEPELLRPGPFKVSLVIKLPRERDLTLAAIAKVFLRCVDNSATEEQKGGYMVEAISGAVIVGQTPVSGHGTHVQFQPRCRECGFIGKGWPMSITISGPGRKEAGSFRCEQCNSKVQPVFVA